MLRKISIIFLLAALILSCGSDNPSNSNSTLTTLEKKLVEADNKFTLKLFQELVSIGPDTNIFVSPLSVSMALGMTLNGAANQTQADMATTLEFAGLSQDETNQAYRNLIDYLVSSDPKVVFSIANSIWYRDNFGFENAFLQSAEDYFDAQVTGADFGQPVAVAEMINNWVDENTNNKIRKILNPSDISNDSVMFLLNAIYFLGTWQYEFDKNYTSDGYFATPTGQKLCKMMIQTNQFDYFETDDFQAIDLPYGDGQFSMTIFLPAPDKNVELLLPEFTNSNWDSWLQSFSRDSVVFQMPRMKLEYEVNLNSVLTSFGMGRAFSALEADFTNMYKTGGLFISYVRHKTFLQVDEEGTEAAAVTIVAIETTSIGPPDQKKYMSVDRPFVLAIRERESGTILFMGKITAPLWEE